MSEPLDPEEDAIAFARRYIERDPHGIDAFGSVSMAKVLAQHDAEVAQLARQLLSAQERVAALEGALRVWAIATGPAHFTMTYHDHERCESIANADLRALAAQSPAEPHE